MINPRISPVTIKGIRYTIEFQHSNGVFLLMSDVQDLTVDAGRLLDEGSRRLSVGEDQNYDDSAMSYFIEERAHEYVQEEIDKGRVAIQVWGTI